MDARLESRYLSSNYTTRNLSEDLIKLKCVLLVCFDFILSIYATLRVICVHWVLYDISSIQMGKHDLNYYCFTMLQTSWLLECKSGSSEFNMTLSRVRDRVMVLNAIFNNISVILWWSALPRENHRPVASP